MADQWEQAAKQFKPDPNAPKPSSGSDDWKLWQQNGETPTSGTPIGETTFSQTGVPGLAKTFIKQGAEMAMAPGESLVTGARQLMTPGSRLEGAANMAKGVGKAALLVGLPRGLGTGADRVAGMQTAGENFDRVMAAAKDVPVDTSKFAAPVLRAQKLNAVTGDTMAPVVRKALGRIGPSTEPLTYEDSRMLASAAGRKAAQLSTAPRVLSRPMAAQTAGLAKGLDVANEGAAESVGMGEPYRNAMSGYRDLARVRDAKDAAIKAAKSTAGRYVLGGLGLGAGYGLYRGLAGE